MVLPSTQMHVAVNILLLLSFLCTISDFVYIYKFVQKSLFTLYIFIYLFMIFCLQYSTPIYSSLAPATTIKNSETTKPTQKCISITHSLPLSISLFFALSA